MNEQKNSNENKIEELEKEVLEEKEEESVENEESENTDELQEEESKIVLNDLSKKEEIQEEVELEEMESIVEVATNYDYRTLKYANMYVLKVKRKTTLISIIMACISITLAVVVVITNPSNYWISIAMGLLSLWTIYNILTEEKKIDKSLERYFFTNAAYTQTFAINDEKIRVTVDIDGTTRAADYSWPYIQEIHVIPEYYFLFLNNGAPIVLDRSPEALLKGTKEELDQLIIEQGKLKPFKVYNKPIVKKLIDINYGISPEEASKVSSEDDKNDESEDKDVNGEK